MMNVATLTVVFSRAGVRIEPGNVSFQLHQDDGPDPIQAATNVLSQYGWEVCIHGWIQQSGGISGGEWIAHVTKVS